MADSTECPVCFEEFKEPKILPCTHSLCLECLQNIEKGGIVQCPLCKADHRVPERGVRAFTENQHVIQLIESDKKMKALEARITSLEQDMKVKKVKENFQEKEQEELPFEFTPEFSSDTKCNVNLLKCCLQQLGDIRTQYSPDCCNKCGRTDSRVELFKCEKCQIAHYCSESCETKEWRRRHSEHCATVTKLEAIVEQERRKLSTSGDLTLTRLTAIHDGRPRFLPRDQNYQSITFHKDKEVLLGSHRGNKTKSFVFVGDQLVDLPEEGRRTSVGLCEINHDLFIVTNLTSKNLCRIHKHILCLHPHASPFWIRPGYKRFHMESRIDSFDVFQDFIYVAFGKLNIIEAIPVAMSMYNMVPCRVTFLGIPNLECVTSICPIRRNKELMFVLVYKVERNRQTSSCIRYINTAGAPVWCMGESADVIVDARTFVPRDLCKDDRGNVYVTDTLHHQVALLDLDGASLRPLLTTVGPVQSIAYRESTGQLHVLHANRTGRRTLVSVYDICTELKGDRLTGTHLRNHLKTIDKRNVSRNLFLLLSLAVAVVAAAIVMAIH